MVDLGQYTLFYIQVITYESCTVENGTCVILNPGILTRFAILQIYSDRIYEIRCLIGKMGSFNEPYR